MGTQRRLRVLSLLNGDKASRYLTEGPCSDCALLMSSSERENKRDKSMRGLVDCSYWQGFVEQLY